MAEKPSGLSILVDEKRVNDLIAQKSGAWATFKSGLNLCAFVVFLLLYTIMALSEPIAQQRALEGYVRNRFDTMAATPLKRVESVSSFWQYVNTSLLPGIYGNNTARFFYPGAEIAKLLELEGSAGANRLLGVARMKAKRVTPGTECTIAAPYSAHFVTCYGPYNAIAEDKLAFGPAIETGDKKFSWRADPTGEAFRGRMATYSQGGFMEVLTSDYNKTFNLMRDMENWDFVNPATRAVFFDFTIYNFNVNLYAVCRIAFEVGPTGLWEKSFDVEVLMTRHMSPIGNREPMDFIIIVLEVVIILFVLFYLFQECSEFVGFEKGVGGLWLPAINWEYFGDAWNILDWINLLLMIIALAVKCQSWGSGAPSVYVGDPDKASLRTFTDLSGVASNVRFIHKLTAFNMMLTWFKGVKYINVLPYISTFMQTVQASQQALGSFIVIFCTVLFGFVLAYSVGFGEQNATFRTPWNAFIFLIRSFLGNADFTDVYDGAPFWGGLLIIFWILGTLFIVMNLFFAIMVSALADAKNQSDGKSARQWEKVVDQLTDIWDMAKEQFRLELRFRLCVPGLYSRIMRRRKANAEKEAERDEAVWMREQKSQPTDVLALGPGNPTCGRRRKPETGEDDDRSDQGSEPDLGPLISQAQLRKMALEDEWDNQDEKSQKSGAVGGASRAGDDAEPTPEQVDLVIDATRHVADGIVERTKGARQVLFEEMAESKEVLEKVGIVLEVLSRRARDLEAQQRQILKQRS
mmetsp:Transcript_77627/g.203805  ORF Transcript_77627/g.203805 Transcript_77627/m.203805 type:complete len:748 (+) Transcript_77627:141-2384(+)